ncbi:DUF485 domain-containing protein [Streptomyces phaeochromogenes]|uniref:DUF485 domain-containing protein n=1 Tax=Streptomyces phaeochromogenes TaxID=1923 RepID=UPI00370FDB1B
MSYDSSPSYPVQPHHPPHNSSPSYSTYPTEPTYPWAPRQPEPEPARQPNRHRHAALGHHSDLRVLRTAYRWQRRVATLTALGYFTLFLVLSAWAPAFMTREVADGLPLGLMLGLFQMPVTCVAIALYEYTARRGVDPIAERIRKQTELDTKRAEAGR